MLAECDDGTTQRMNVPPLGELYDYVCAVFVYKIITNEAGKTTHNDLKPKDGIPNFKNKYPKIQRNRQT